MSLPSLGSPRFAAAKIITAHRYQTTSQADYPGLAFVLRNHQTIEALPPQLEITLMGRLVDETPEADEFVPRQYRVHLAGTPFSRMLDYSIQPVPVANPHPAPKVPKILQAFFPAHIPQATRPRYVHEIADEIAEHAQLLHALWTNGNSSGVLMA